MVERVACCESLLATCVGARGCALSGLNERGENPNGSESRKTNPNLCFLVTMGLITSSFSVGGVSSCDVKRHA